MPDTPAPPRPIGEVLDEIVDHIAECAETLGYIEIRAMPPHDDTQLTRWSHDGELGDLVDAADTWLRQEVPSYLEGDHEAVKVRLWGPKGSRLEGSPGGRTTWTLTEHQLAGELLDEVLDEVEPLHIAPEDLAMQRAVAMMELGTRAMEASERHFARIRAAEVEAWEGMRKEQRALRTHVETLVQRAVDRELAVVDREREAMREEQAHLVELAKLRRDIEDAKTKGVDVDDDLLGRGFDLVERAIGLKGLPKELVDDPEFAAALKNPKVIESLRDPDTRAQVKAVLHSLAEES